MLYQFMVKCVIRLESFGQQEHLSYDLEFFSTSPSLIINSQNDVPVTHHVVNY
jgi:hypothetical protein